MTQKTRNIIGWILTGLLSIVMLGSAIMKLTASQELLNNAAHWGLSPHKFKLIAFTEIICFIIFVIPRTGIAGTLLLAAYIGGAIATHVEHFMPVSIPVLVECLVWITAAVRFPELTRRLVGKLH